MACSDHAGRLSGCGTTSGKCGWRLAMPLLLGGITGHATGAATVRAGEHGDFSRVVFTLPAGITYRARMIGNLLVLSFRHAGQMPSANPPPAHMLSVTGGQDQAAIGVPSGLHAHVWQIDQRVIVDVFAGPPPPP